MNLSYAQTAAAIISMPATSEQNGCELILSDRHGHAVWNEPALIATRIRRPVAIDGGLYLDARVAAGAVILIAPKEPLEISRVCHDPNVMQRIYDIGRKAGETANLRELSQFKRCMQAFG